MFGGGLDMVEKRPMEVQKWWTRGVPRGRFNAGGAIQKSIERKGPQLE